MLIILRQFIYLNDVMFFKNVGLPPSLRFSSLLGGGNYFVHTKIKLTPKTWNYHIIGKSFLYLCQKLNVMSENFFDKSTAAIGAIYTVIALGVIASILIWG